MSQVTDGNLEPTGFQHITDLSVPVGMNTGGGRIALIQAEDKGVRWRDDGEDPTANVGMYLEAGRDFWYTGKLSALKFIGAKSGAKLNVSFYR